MVRRRRTFRSSNGSPADPAVIERGKALYQSTCAACHGIDLRGGQQGGPNLLRSQTVLSDKNGELIGPSFRVAGPIRQPARRRCRPFASPARRYQGAGRISAQRARPGRRAGTAAGRRPRTAGENPRRRRRRRARPTSPLAVRELPFRDRRSAGNCVARDRSARVAGPLGLWRRRPRTRRSRSRRRRLTGSAAIDRSRSRRRPARPSRAVWYAIDDFVVTLIQDDGTRRTFARNRRRSQGRRPRIRRMRTGSSCPIWPTRTCTT